MLKEIYNTTIIGKKKVILGAGAIAKSLFKLFLLGLLVQIIFIAVRVYLAAKGVSHSHTHPTTDLVRGESEMLALIFLFLTSVILDPFIEEFSFRYFIGTNARALLMGLSAMIALSFLSISGIYLNTGFNTNLSFYIPFVMGSISLFGLILLLTNRFRKVYAFVSSRPVYQYVFISSLLFAPSHYRLVATIQHSILYFLLFGPFFLNGFIYSYSRLFIGFGYAVVLACCKQLSNIPS